jgi:hypothetical protein
MNPSGLFIAPWNEPPLPHSAHRVSSARDRAARIDLIRGPRITRIPWGRCKGTGPP